MKKSIFSIPHFCVLFLTLMCFSSCENPLLIDAAKLYKVTFETNCDTDISSYRTSTVEKIQTLSKTDATFAGWYTTSSFSGSPITLPYDLSEDTTLYAKWLQQYSVAFVTNGGTELAGYKTSAINELPISTRTDYEFAGWYTTADFAGEAVSFPYALTEATVLYAKWRQVYFTVMFETNGGTELASYKVSVISEKPLTTKSDCEFAGWYTTSDFAGEAINFPFEVTESVVLYAKWNKIYTVSFVTNGGTAISQYQTATITEPPATTRTGYTFLAWYVDEDFSTPVAFPYTLDGETTLYAKWTESTETAYTVEHYKQSTDLASYTLAETVEMTGMTQTTTQAAKKIYTGFTAKDFEQIAIAADGSTVVKIYYDRNTYTVSFDANGGSGEMESQTFYYGVEQTLVENGFTRNKYSFNGWATSRSGSVAYKINTAYSIQQNITLYAVWTYKNNNISVDDISSLDLSDLTDEYTIHVSGTLSESDLATLAEKISATSQNITLDLSGVTGLTEISVSSSAVSPFATCINLKEIILPNTLETVGKRAFYGCTGLESVVVGTGTTTIDSSAFYDCSSLSAVTLPSGLTSIASSAFYNCSALAEITIPDSVTSIGNTAFYNCTALESVSISTDLTSLSSSAFTNCTNIHNLTYTGSGSVTSDLVLNKTGIQNVTITDTVTSISESAFTNATSLKNATIGDGVTTIGNAAFDGCTVLAKVLIGDSVLSIGSYAFQNCTNLVTADLPSKLTTISEGAFKNCSSLKTVIIPDSVTILGSYAYYENESLSTLVIGDGVKGATSSSNPYISTYAFYGCTSLESVTIPDHITTLQDNSFVHCTNLILELGTNIVTKTYSSSTSLSKAINGCKGVEIKDGVESIGEYAFYGSSVTSIVVPKSVIAIGKSAFAGCSDCVVTLETTIVSKDFTSDSNLGSCFNTCKQIVLPPGITKIGAYVFYQSTVKDIVIPDGVTSIGNYAFYRCSSLTSITIPNGVTSIGKSTFSGCTGLTSITIPDSVTSIGEYAFYGCSSLTDITIPDSITNICDSAFSGCTRLTSITIPDSVTSIGSNAFYGCSSLMSITIPDGVTSIGSYAFNGCSSLMSITIPDGVTSIGSYAFDGCSSLMSITIPDGVTSISGYTFRNCTSLTSITLPDGVTNIGYYAFFGCTSLTSITIPRNVTKIGSYVFEGCTTLKSIEAAYPDGWYRTTSSYNNGTSTSLSNPTDNAKYFTDTYKSYYWYR